MQKVIITLIIAGIGGLIGIKAKIPAGAFLGALVLVAAYNIVSGNAELSQNLKLGAQIVLGGVIGLNFTLDTVYELKKMILPTFILVCGLMIFSVLLGLLIYKLTGMDLATALFGTSPGGLADMTLIAEAYGADTSKVVAMHSARLITVIVILPIIIGFVTEYLKK